MPQIGVAITKSVSFRGVQQEFSNVYHYGSAELLTADAEALLDTVRAFETNLHSSDVTFVRGRAWSSGGTEAQNQMLIEKNFAGTGSQTVITTLDRERAVLIQWPAGTNTLGRPVFLRKWYHTCGNIASQTFSSAEQQNTSAISLSKRQLIETAVNDATVFQPNGHVAELRAESGRQVQGVATCHLYLEHHQLGDAWR